MAYVQPPDLQKIYGDLSTIPADFAYNQAQQAQQANSLNMDVERQRLAEDTAASPFNLADKASRMQNQARADDLSATLYPGQKENALVEQQRKTQQLQIPDINNLAQGFTQAAAATKANGGQVPLWLAPHLPKHIVDALNQPGGPDQLMAAGEAIRKNADKFVAQESKQGSAADIAETKANAARDVADKAAAARRYAADAAVRRAQVALQGKPAKQDKQSYENYAVKLEQEADNLAMSDDGTHASKVAYLKQKANEYRAAAQNMKAAGAIVNQEIPNKLLFPGGTPPSPQSSQPGQAPQANVLPDPLGLRK